MVDKYGLFSTKLFEKRLKYEDLRGIPPLKLLENRLFYFISLAIHYALLYRKTPRNWFFTNFRKFADFLPRAIIYPIVKYLIYFEYLFQKMFRSNRKNNIFMKTKKIARVDFESVANEKSLKKKSLRGFVTKNRIPLENLNIPEKVRQSLRAGL